MALYFSSQILICLSCFFLLSQNSVKAQQESDADNEILRYTPPLEIQRKLPYFLSGYDKEGTPVWVFEFGKWDVRALAEKGVEYPKEIEKYTDTMFQKMHAFGGGDHIILVDLDGYDNRQFTSYLGIQQIFNMARQFVKANPRGQGIKQVYLVNSNYLFQTVYGLVKPILGSLANFIELYGTNPDKWMPVILKQIPKDQIPQWLGGSNNHVPLEVYG